MNKSGNIVICGVGGQGIVLFGKVLGEFLLRKGYELKVSDIVGLGQRGGSVVCHLRFSDKRIMSPLIKTGDADYLISFEQTETLRNVHYLKGNGVIFTGVFNLSSSSVNVGIEKDIQGDKIHIIKESGRETFVVDMQKYEEPDVDLSQMTNVAMLGVFASYIGFDHLEVMDTIKENVNSKFIEDNIKAYEIGLRIFEDKGFEN